MPRLAPSYAPPPHPPPPPSPPPEYSGGDWRRFPAGGDKTAAIHSNHSAGERGLGRVRSLLAPSFENVRNLDRTALKILVWRQYDFVT